MHLGFAPATSKPPPHFPPSHPRPQDIYIARAEGELALEEELWGVLLVVYKTPMLLGQLTRQDGRPGGS